MVDNLSNSDPWVGARGRQRRAFAVAVVTAALAAPATGSAADKVTFNMSWLPQGSVGGIIVAIDKGYYKDAGIDANAVRGYGGLRTVNEIDQGKFAFGYGNPVGVVLNRSKGGKTRMIGAVNTRWPAGLCFIKERRNPRTIADLKGLVAGGGKFSPVHKVVPPWLIRNGFKTDHIKLLLMQPAVINASLLAGKIDLAECWLASNRPLLDSMAKDAGMSIGWIEYRKFGLNAYGSGLTTSDKLIKEKPGLVRRFVKATYKGYAFLAKNPEESADIVVKKFSVLKRKIVLAQIKDINELIVDPEVKGKGLGWQTEKRMKDTVSFVAAAYKISGSISASDIYTNDFLK